MLVEGGGGEAVGEREREGKGCRLPHSPVVGEWES